MARMSKVTGLVYFNRGRHQWILVYMLVIFWKGHYCYAHENNIAIALPLTVCRIGNMHYSALCFTRHS